MDSEHVGCRKPMTKEIKLGHYCGFCGMSDGHDLRVLAKWRCMSFTALLSGIRHLRVT
jgi:hypothetical protein